MAREVPVRARALARQLNNTGLAIIDKRRPKPNVAEAMNIIGDVQGKVCVLIDDMIDTSGTLCEAAGSLLDEGQWKWLPTSPIRC